MQCLSNCRYTLWIKSIHSEKNFCPSGFSEETSAVKTLNDKSTETFQFLVFLCIFDKFLTVFLDKNEKKNVQKINWRRNNDCNFLSGLDSSKRSIMYTLAMQYALSKRNGLCFASKTLQNNTKMSTKLQRVFANFC